MLNIIMSSFCAPGHDRIKGEILKRVNDGQRVIMIVPEQQTVLAEAEMADFLPSSAPLNFEVTNFTRLANSTARALGGISGEYCDKTKKSLLMWQALSELSPMLSTAVSKQINEGLVARYLNATAQLSAFNISAEELENAKRSLRNAYMQIYDSAEGMESWTLNRSLSGNHDTPEWEKEKLEATTVEEIVEYAKGITLDTVYFLKGESKND